MLSTIACFRSPIELTTLEAISRSPKEEKPKGLFGLFKKKASSDYTGNIEVDLNDLVTRGLLHFDEKNKKFDLHPIVRRFAYDRLLAPERTGAHVILVVYFEAVPQPQKIEKLEDLAPVIELYHHMVRAGKLDEAWLLFRDRIWQTLFYRLGGYQIQIELLATLFVDGENNPPKLKQKLYQAHCINELANACSLSGQPRRAMSLYEMHNTMREKTGDKKNLAKGLGNLAIGVQLNIGFLHAAEANHRRRIELAKEIQEEFDEAIGHQELGHLLVYRGEWAEAENELVTALRLFDDPNSNVRAHWMGYTYSYMAFRLIWKAPQEKLDRTYLDRMTIVINDAINFMQEYSNTNYPVEREHVRNHWLLGIIQRLKNQHNEAEHHLSEALTRGRGINLAEFESNILLEFARLRYGQKNYEEAKSLADEALLITERCDYVLQGADVNLFLAQYALEQEKDKAKAKEYAEIALKLATCDGPPYYYKVAYEEAKRLLERLKV